MPISILPKTVTKDVLFKKAQERFQDWAKMYADNNVSVQWMYEDMCASSFCGCPADDFPDEVKAEQDSTIRYQYKDGACFFMVDDIEVEVLDLRDMREDPSIGFARYSDVCIPAINYTDDDGTGSCMHHPIPDTWLYGSTSSEFNEGKPVHPEFIEAAKDFIKMRHITKEMQKYLE